MSLLIGEIVRLTARMTPTAVAATLCGRRITFGELDRQANRTANALAGLGVRAGDRVAWSAAPTLRTLDGFVACARLGAVFVPLNPGLSPVETEAVLDYLEPRLLVSDRTDAPAGAPLAGLGGAPGAGADLDALTARAAATAPAGADRLADTDPHIIYLTSGSTGQPKGALVSHRASWLRAAPGGGTFTAAIRGPGGVLCSFPLYHYGGWHYVLEAWQNRTAVHLVPRADAARLIDVVRTERPAALYCIPAVWERLLDSEHRRADLSSLRHADTGTSALPADLVARIKDRLPGTTTTILYGSTEAGRMSALPDADLARKPGSVGRPAFPGALWVAAEGVGQVGEVLVTGPALMSGYHRLPAETAAALPDGVYRSGDLGRLDEEGYLHLTGRVREVIRTGGESVSPVEVEAALRGLAGVVDVAVVGLPDDRWGEVVCAVLVLAPGATPPDVGTVRGHVAGRLAGFKQPRRVVVLPAIPRTPATGQVQRSRIRESLRSAS
ncbi:class I adenylate-forming enzyme family protein [Micromonospora sp. DT46]|uniref:class I adenylate-forming enzyme family protein n=1 Tax=unclassified Micromonospora TaxID=2617518 RepID=UPI00124B1251|nr:MULTISPECIES: AMP-binding protein [unclassified Micromonospora]KAB1162335.1 long-chain fatty acid--CoA ligase [Micromonospora sp. AMSO12t]WSG01388.1 AMP-binding protein [Micromonospora sp. NBC_01740]